MPTPRFLTTNSSPWRRAWKATRITSPRPGTAASPSPQKRRGFALPTEKARQVLPAQYSRADAVHNLQRAAVLAALLFSGRPELHRTFFNDRWHQPFRAPLIPGLAEVLEIKHADLLAVCLSGAGPSVLAIVRANAESVGQAIVEAFAGKGVKAQAHVLAADNLGAKGWSLLG
ncbi:MAG: hypothetical protein DMG21_17795 [Acidobacteria bacterium]|nr:MAG: hypothetical protein DMG21_17795 [Acidobacteriota bacterium]